MPYPRFSASRQSHPRSEAPYNVPFPRAVISWSSGALGWGLTRQMNASEERSRATGDARHSSGAPAKESKR